MRISRCKKLINIINRSYYLSHFIFQNDSVILITTFTSKSLLEHLYFNKNNLYIRTGDQVKFFHESKEKFLDYQLALSTHASTRMAQRNLSLYDIDYVMAYGTMYQRTGVTFYFLGKKDIPEVDRNNSKISRLIGTTILADSQDIDEGEKIITTYRNKFALRKILRKTKYELFTNN